MNSKPHISQYKDKADVKLIEFDSGKKVYLIGTAHVSNYSADLVTEISNEIKPDAIAIELDKKRYQVLKNKSSFENLDIIKILKNKETFFFIGHLLLSSFQKKISDKVGVKPGLEFKRAIDYVEKNKPLAQNKPCKLHLIDRSIEVTLKRAWRSAGFWGQLKLISSLLFVSEKEQDIDEKVIEDLKNENEFSQIVKELANTLPTIKEALIDERDIYLAGGIQNIKEQVAVVVVGAGHVPGIQQALNKPITEDQLRKLDLTPKVNILWKLVPWLIPLAIIALFLFGFLSGNVEESKTALWGWVIANGGLSAIGCIIALAHPMTIIVAFLAAPITSLNPTVGAGMVTALVQIFFARPRVIDFVNIQENASKINKWWSNRLTKVLMVFVFSSVGSAIGTLVAFPMLAKIFPN